MNKTVREIDHQIALLELQAAKAKTRVQAKAILLEIQYLDDYRQDCLDNMRRR